MLDKNNYVPVIKWKRGEKNALKQMSAADMQVMMPLIEIQPIPYNTKEGSFEKTLDEHLEDIGLESSQCLLAGHPIFVDVWTLYDNEEFDATTLLNSGKHPVEFIVDDFESNNLPVIPVTGLYRFDEYHDAIKSVVSKYQRGVCIRLTRDELLDLTQLESDLDALMEFIGVSAEIVDIVLDYGYLADANATKHVSEIVMCLSQFPKLNDWRSLTICSTSFPDTVSRFVATKSNGSILRTDWKAYQMLRKLNLPRIPTYGDYNIANPAFSLFDPVTMKMAADLKYTTDEHFLIFRGKVINGNGFSQMQGLCQDVVSHPKFKGGIFSYGDDYIEKCAHGLAKNGNKQTWVTVGVNHHLTQVLSDLSILP